MRRRYIVKAGVVILFLALGAHLAYPTVVLHRNLKDLVDISDRIFRGRCASMHEGELEIGKGKIYYTEYTFYVTEAIKGNVAETITFRQYGLTKPRQVSDKLMLYHTIPLMPIYQPETEYLLFLIGDSKYGLTSPVGLSQGAFLIRIDQSGREVAVNGFSNRGLFKKMDLAQSTAVQLSSSERRLVAQAKGPFAVTDFVSVVRKVVAANN